MRTLKVIEHISLDGVIQNSTDGDDFPRALEPTDATSTPSGLAIHTYKVAGPLKTRL
jgi:hypothetical protein